MIAEVLALYGSEAAPEKKTARNIAYRIGSLLNWWGEKTTAEISPKSCKEYTKTKTATAAAADIKTLRAAVKYWHGSECGPLNVAPIFWQPKENPPKERWLTKSEAARLLFHARRYQHLRRMILLGLYTGSRPGVILALQWSQVDFTSGVMSRVMEGARQDERKRAPKVKLGRRILAHLKRWKRLDGKGGKFVCGFEGRAVIDPWRSWAKAIEAAGLDGVTRHTLRHTRATWMAQAGVPLWDAAGFLGMTVKTFEAVYGHHSPDHQERAANI